MKPYTYLIGWSSLGKWYYGSRFGKDCDPSDLWVKYFTSSKYVAETRELYGEPDVIQVRKTFDSVDACRLFEGRVLQRLHAATSEKWLNRIEIWPIPPEVIVNSNKKRQWYTNGDENVSIIPDIDEVPDGFYRGRRVHWLGDKSQRSKTLAYTDGSSIVYATALEERPCGKEWIRIDVRELIKGKRNCYTNGVETKLFSIEEVPDGWTKGRHWNNSGENNPMYGRRHSEHTKQLIQNKRKRGTRN